MLGILLSLIVAVCYGISATMQKYAVSRMVSRKKKFSFSGLFTSWRWFAALGVGAIGTGSYVFAMRYAPLSSVQVFLALTIVIPIIAGFVFFKEKLHIGEWLCVALIVSGVLLTVL